MHTSRGPAIAMLLLSGGIIAWCQPHLEVRVPYSLLNFENPGPIPGACFAGAVREASPSREAAHSGRMGLAFRFDGAPEKSGGQYFAVPSDMVAQASAIRFWLRRQAGPGRSTMTLTIASDDYQTQWHHPIPLDFAGWREFTFRADEFTVSHPPGVKPDWRRNYWVYFTADGPDPLAVDLDDVQLLVLPGAASGERLLTNQTNPRGNFVFNTRLQVVYSRSAPALISRVTAFRRELLGAASLIVAGQPVEQAALAATDGVVTVGGRQYRLNGSVAASGFRVAAYLKCEPPAPLVVRLPINGETYTNQGFELGPHKGQFTRGPAGVLAAGDEGTGVVLGSKSKCRLAIEPGAATSATLRRAGNGSTWLELGSGAGAVDFALAAPTEDVEISLSTDRYHNVYQVQDAGSIAVKARFRNNTARSRWCSYEATVTDFEGCRVASEVASVRLAAGATVERVLCPAIARLGFYKLVIVATDSVTGETFRKFLTLGVISPVIRLNPPDPSGHFGVHFFARTPEAARLISRVGITWTRDCIYWDNMEPRRGEYNWGPMETYAANAANAGLWVLPIQAGYGAAWAQLRQQVSDKWGKTTQCDLAAWGRYWSEMAHRYRGRVGGWEISNETYWAPVSFVAEAHRVAYRAIHEQDPLTPVLANVTIGYGGTVDYLREFLAAGGAEGCDVISAHPYCGYQSSPEQGRMREVGARVNEIIKPYFKHPRQWWTEYGWMGDDEYDPNIPGVETDWAPNIISERAMAQYVVRAYLASMAAGVERSFYFLDQDTATWQFPSGLMREEGIRPAVCAVNTVCRLLEYTSFVTDVRLRDDVELMVFRGKGCSIAAVWTTAAPERAYELRAPLSAGDVQAFDLMGNERRLARISGGVATRFDGSPVFLVSRRLSPDALAQALSRGRVEGGTVEIGRVFLKPGEMTLELSNSGTRPAEAHVRVLDPPPAAWELRATSATGPVPPGGTARLSIPRAGTLPADGASALLRMQVNAEPVVAREYRLLRAPRATGTLSVTDAPATWGPVTAILDRAEQTMSCVSGVISPSAVWQGPADLSARLWVRWDRERLWIGIAVRDDVHCLAVGSLADMWKGDSVQYGFDAAGNAPTKPPDGWDISDDSEWLAGLLDGQARLVRTSAPKGLGTGDVLEVAHSISRSGDTTTYVAAFPWRTLAPATGEEGTILGFNFIVNDDDGTGRKGWIGLTGGMGEAKAPRLFRKILLVR